MLESKIVRNAEQITKRDISKQLGPALYPWEKKVPSNVPFELTPELQEALAEGKILFEYTDNSTGEKKDVKLTITPIYDERPMRLREVAIPRRKSYNGFGLIAVVLLLVGLLYILSVMK